MEEKKERAWRVSVKPSGNGWCNFYARKAGVVEKRQKVVRSVTLAWSCKENRFAQGVDLKRFNELCQSDKKEIMQQMREILRLGLPALPGESWPDGDFA